MLEKVEEFQDWSPIGDDSHPVKSERGPSWQRWAPDLSQAPQTSRRIWPQSAQDVNKSACLYGLDSPDFT